MKLHIFLKLSTTKTYRYTFMDAATKPHLLSLPLEILQLIMHNLEQRDVLHVISCNKHLSQVITEFIYRHLTFASTYILAQFFSIIATRNDYVLLSHNLDISSFIRTAGWGDPYYTPIQNQHSPSNHLPKNRARSVITRTPRPSLVSDISIEGLRNCIRACKLLKSVNFSKCEVKHLPAGTALPVERKMETIDESMECLVAELVKLTKLKSIIAGGRAGLSTKIARRLVNDGKDSLYEVDFVGCDSMWAFNGSREEVRKIIATMDEECRELREELTRLE